MQNYIYIYIYLSVYLYANIDMCVCVCESVCIYIQLETRDLRLEARQARRAELLLGGISQIYYISMYESISI